VAVGKWKKAAVLKKLSKYLNFWLHTIKNLQIFLSK